MANILIGLAILVAVLQYNVLATYTVVDGHTYFISTPIRKNWYQAERDCLQRGLHLADPRNQQENELIINLLRMDYKQNTSPQRNTTNYWISGTDLGSHGTYYWSTNGDLIEFDYFKSGYPDQVGVEHCAEYHPNFDYQWNDNTCEKSQYYICRSTGFTPHIYEKRTSNYVTDFNEI